MNPLEQAVEKIENGWCQGRLVKDGKVCAIGAIAWVELDVDLNLLDRSELPPWNTPERAVAVQERRDLTRKVYDQASELKSVRVLADEILGTDLWDEMKRDYLAEVGASDTSFALLYSDPVEVVMAYNDAADDQNEVIETFKYAAKRYDEV